MRETWYGGGRRFDKQIVVPFAFESPKSGIGDTTFHPVVWYQRDAIVPGAWKGRRVLLAVRRRGLPGQVWMNGSSSGIMKAETYLSAST